MFNLSAFLSLAGSALAGYLLGSVSVAVLLTRRLGKDVREQGSGNAGATNVARVYGMKTGLLTLLGDMAKTALSALLGWLLAGPDGLAVACTACLLGHCFPLYFKFRGGKGVSVGACIALFLDWRMFLALAALFFLVFLLSRRVSLCSVCAALSYPGLYYLFDPALSLRFWLCCGIGLLVIFLHRGNILRLLKGEEAVFRPGSQG